MSTAAQVQTVKAITENMERGYQAVQRAGNNLRSLLAIGKARCEDLKAYNSWAIAFYHDQEAILDTARQAGEPSVPFAPPMPRLFTSANGRVGRLINCDITTNSLNGALAAAMAPVTSQSTFIDPRLIRVTQGVQHDLGPTPSYATLSRMAAGGGLGDFGLTFLIIAGITLILTAIGVAAALAGMFEERGIQQETTARSALQLEAFARQTEARNACYLACIKSAGANSSGCVADCNRLIPEVKLVTDSARKQVGLSFFSTVGLVLTAGVAGVAAFMLFRRPSGRAPMARVEHDAA